MMKKAAQNVKAVAVRAGMLMKDTKGENYVDTAVKILIAVVLMQSVLGETSVGEWLSFIPGCLILTGISMVYYFWLSLIHIY